MSGRRVAIPAKIISETPLPIPTSLIFSPRKILNVGKTRFQKDGTIFVYDLERCTVDLFRYKSKLPYDYYKEVLRNLRSRLGEMDVRKLQDYISKMPRQERLMRMMMEELL